MTGLLIDQLDFYLDAHMMPRLDGLTDEEYFWSPLLPLSPCCTRIGTAGAGVWLGWVTAG